MRFQFTREFFIPKNIEFTQEKNGGIVYGYTDNKISAVAFKGKAQKPTWHYIFKTEQARQEYIDKWFHQLEVFNQYKQDIKKARKQEVMEANIKIGDYFYTSWGYDQTNIDYLIVVNVTPKTAICKMVNPIYVDAEEQQDVLMPGTAYGDTFRMRINGKDSLVGSYPYCGDSSKRLGHFSKTSLTELHRQTNPIFGH